MNYKVITDEQMLKEFIQWLPELKETEKYYLCLFARSKYTKDADGNNGIAHIKSDKAQLKRFVSDKKRMFEKIKQLEVEEGSYFQRTTPIPQESLALYITVNPRDMWKATFNSMIKLAQCIRDQNLLLNPHQEVMSEIQRTKGTTYYIDFDVDVKEADTFSKIKNLTDQLFDGPVSILETRGGYHVLVQPDKAKLEQKSNWYKVLSIGLGADQVGDCMIPVPGTYQGGFTPHFVTY